MKKKAKIAFGKRNLLRNDQLINKNKSKNSSTNFEVKNKSTESFILKKIKEN